ncbi:MAG: amidohydrolase family protein [Defluviitaleaceae bacterium]|nr:amidohydrolase family protein [Defluviitaleaceae bacterium]
MYNCHSHAAMTLLRGFADDRFLEDWLFNHILPAEEMLTPQLVYTGTTIAIAEMIASGTIAFTDMYFHMDQVAQAAQDAGVLANVSNAVVSFDKDSYNLTADNVYHQTLRAIENNNSDGRVKVEASIHGAYTSFPNAWRQVLDFAQKHGLAMHVHLSETRAENETVRQNFDKTPTEIFYEHGIFDIPTTAAHGVWLTDNDITLLAEKSVTVAHNPISNLKLASGLAPAHKMLQSGVNVTIGTDGMASNNSHDLFEEIKMSSLLQKHLLNDPTAMPAAAALQLATTNGAKAQGRPTSGQIQTGYDADLVLIDQNNPRHSLSFCPISALAYSTTGRDVEMTICRGKVLYEKGEYKTIDIEKVMFEARDAIPKFLSTRK